MRITDFDVDHRNALFSFDSTDAKLLLSCKPAMEQNVDFLVNEYLDASGLIRLADERMYVAKQAHKNAGQTTSA